MSDMGWPMTMISTLLRAYVHSNHTLIATSYVIQLRCAVQCAFVDCQDSIVPKLVAEIHKHTEVSITRARDAFVASRVPMKSP